MPPPKKESEEELKLEWKDYLAMMIAALQTVALPVVFLFAVVLVIAIIFGLLAGITP
jgi:hypothetical protein